MYKDFREKATRAYITNIPDEPEMDEIMAKFALWPATLLVEEWKESNNDTEEEALVFEGTCSCPFNSKFGLQHCRHIFRSRRMAGLSLLDMELVPVRWREPTFIPEEPLSTPLNQAGQASGAGFMVEVESEVTAPKTHNERYLQAKEICLRISSLQANTGGAQYISGIKAIKKLEAILRRGDETIVTVAGETTCNNNDNNTQEENMISRDDPPEMICE
ncbi:uncharacterized protein LOC127749468 [Frankliniella occidentalis]|uniref:Uncharacterized protein LOC127749468 n=1 Tax=Frankliniella occidentalis TaxID=133901 RepID=A0A9C6U876_FRAOC|nr:uncharacterized protein LOC127749468 [Frankliniella occidentalis]